MLEERICAMYISNFHLVTLLVPYIDEKIKENKDVFIVSDISFKNDFEKYLNNVKDLSENLKNVIWKDCYDFEVSKGDSVIVINDKIDVDFTGDIDLLKCINVFKIDDVFKIYDDYDLVLKSGGKIISINSHKGHKKEIIKS